MNNLSLQDQLLKAGLSNNAKAKRIKTEKRKQTQKQRKNKVEIVDTTKQSVHDAKASLIEKDRLLNQQRNKEVEEKQIANQIIQLINNNKLPKDEEGIAYNFTDQNKVKVIYINEKIRNKIISGQLAIVKSKNNYEVVAVEVAEKIRQREEHLVIVLFADKTEISGDDEYQGYDIPDDLIW